MSSGSMEANSLATVAMHLRHFERTLGERLPLPQLDARRPAAAR